MVQNKSFRKIQSMGYFCLLCCLRFYYMPSYIQSCTVTLRWRFFFFLKFLKSLLNSSKGFEGTLGFCFKSYDFTSSFVQNLDWILLEYVPVLLEWQNDYFDAILSPILQNGFNFNLESSHDSKTILFLLSARNYSMKFNIIWSRV